METIFLTAFFKFDKRGSRWGFDRMHLQHIWKTEEEARENISFCDEAGWYEGVLIEEREFGWRSFRPSGKRIWLLQQEDVSLKEISEPMYLSNIVGIIE